jgi:undecaprenyl-diphosphatase
MSHARTKPTRPGATRDERWKAFQALPRVAHFLKRFAPQVEWLQRRLSPEGYLGLHLTVGALVVVGMCWLFGGITEDVLHGEPLTLVDARVAAFFNAHATPWLTRAMFAISFTASGRFLIPVSGAIAVYLVWRHAWYRLLALLLVVPGGTLLNVVAKHLIHRQRPVFENPIATLDSYSFPSGHTMAATLFYGLLAAFAVGAFRGWKPKTLAVVGAFFMVLLVAFSRICLGLHYLSDVLGSMAAGLAWLAFSLTAVETFRRRPGNRESA